MDKIARQCRKERSFEVKDLAGARGEGEKRGQRRVR